MEGHSGAQTRQDPPPNPAVPSKACPLVCLLRWGAIHSIWLFRGQVGRGTKRNFRDHSQSTGAPHSAQTPESQWETLKKSAFMHFLQPALV